MTTSNGIKEVYLPSFSCVHVNLLSGESHQTTYTKTKALINGEGSGQQDTEKKRGGGGGGREIPVIVEDFQKSDVDDIMPAFQLRAPAK
jgi:hypothetical protein